MRRLTVSEYFRLPESQRPMELTHGVVREPPAPRYGHQSVVTRLTALLDSHVRTLRLGVVCVSPVDVVLDEAAALVVQPDLIFVSEARLDIVKDRIWGAPDLVVEVLSGRTARRDRTTKRGWYRKYGVREYWIVDPKTRSVEVVSLGTPCRRGRRYTGEARMRSGLLTDWNARPCEIFGLFF